MQSIAMLSAIYSECRKWAFYAEYQYTDCRYAEGHYVQCHDAERYDTGEWNIL
jgi:hypothetical protein